MRMFSHSTIHFYDLSQLLMLFSFNAQSPEKRKKKTNRKRLWLRKMM